MKITKINPTKTAGYADGKDNLGNNASAEIHHWGSGYEFRCDYGCWFSVAYGSLAEIMSALGNNRGWLVELFYRAAKDMGLGKDINKVLFS